MILDFSNKRRITFFLVIGMLMFISACKYSSQQNDLIHSLEESGVEIPDEVKQLQGFNLADIMFPLGGLFMFGVFVFAGLRQFKRKKAEFGYALGDINEKIKTITNDSEIAEKMSIDESKNLEDFMKFLNKGN